MNSQPDLCVDIFSQMANLLASFTNNVRNADSEYFSHDTGFQQATQQNAVTNDGSQLSFEESINQSVQWVFIGSMVMFLLYQ